MKIAITGTPGTGKTTVSNLLSKKLKIPVYHLSELIKERELYSEYDKERESYVVDIKKLKDFFKGKENFIAEGLVAHYIPSDVLVILRASPETIKKRLSERNYSPDKIEENVEAERLAVCATEALQLKTAKKIIQIDTTHKNPDEIAKLIIDGIKGKEVFDDVDWLGDEWSI